MKTIEQIKARCEIDHKCWIWAGGKTGNNVPSIFAPDHTKGGMRTQQGRRAVWHMTSVQPIHPGWVVFGTCDEPLCLNPDHIRCAPRAKHGERMAASGKLKNNTRKIIANRAILRKRASLTLDQITQICLSEETGRAISARLGIPATTISKARRGAYKCYSGIGMFSGLGARA